MAGLTRDRFALLRWIARNLYVQVILAIVAGAVLGFVWPSTGEALKPLGDGFIKLIKMAIPPVIFLTVVTGIGAVREAGAIGRVFGKALAYFITVSGFALVVGLFAANIVQPGAGMNIDPRALDASAISNYEAQAHEETIVGFLLAIIPDTMMSAFTQGSVLQVLLVAILLGFALSAAGKPAQPVLIMFETLSIVVFRMIAILMKFAPIGAFGAIAFTIGKFGLGTLANLGVLIGLFYGTCAFFIVVVLGAIAAFNGFSIFQLIKYLKAEILTVIGTSSSETVLPNLIQKMERAGCSKSVVGLVVPTGYSFNLDGTNIYMTLAALFIAQACNVDLSLGDQIALLAVAMISSKGAAGVTGAGFITLAATLTIVPTIPVAGLALILGIDRFMSECRSVTNFIGNAVATVVISRWENALDKDVLRQTLRGEAQSPLRAGHPSHSAAGYPD